MMVLLDSSAWLAHLFGEPGMEEVNQIFEEESAEVSISTVSIPEVCARLTALGRQDRWPQVWAIYSDLFTRILPVDEAVAHEAVALREGSAVRLPTVDALIAATAAVHGLTLVHRDPHMTGIPADLLSQQVLPSN